MITRIRHTGFYLNKKDMRMEVEFYKKLGFEVFYGKVEKWPFFGIIDVIKMKTPNGEVLEFVGEDRENHTPSDCHVALQVENLNEVVMKLGLQRFLVHPMLSEDKKHKVAFMADPLGFILELVEKL